MNPLETEELRACVRRYVECRRLGLTKDFIIPRLVAAKPFVPPKGPGAPAVQTAREFLPGISNEDIKPLSQFPASIPRGSMPWFDIDSGRCFVVKDSIVSHVFVVSEDGKECTFHCWISSLDLKERQTPEMRRIADQAKERVTKGTGRKPGERAWMGGYWMELGTSLNRVPGLQWQSPEALNPTHIFD